MTVEPNVNKKILQIDVTRIGYLNKGYKNTHKSRDNIFLISQMYILMFCKDVYVSIIQMETG